MKRNQAGHGYTEGIKDKLKDLGADLVGVTDTEPLKQLRLDPPTLLDPFYRAIAIAISLPRAVFEQIDDRPIPLYFSRCVQKLTNEFSRLPNIDAAICGVCIKVCPFGR